MTKDTQLKEQFLPHQDHPPSANPQSAEWFMALFDKDKIDDKWSNRQLESVGGYDGLQRGLNTNLGQGINASESDKTDRINRFGRNDPMIKEPPTVWDMVMENFEDLTVQILCVAAVVSLILGVATEGWEHGWLQGVSILLAVVIITVVTTVNNYMKEKQFRKLNEMAARKNVNVTRGGHVINMSVYQLLVGDIVQIQTGQILSVDGIVVQANRLKIDESAMTGQNKTISKSLLVNNSNDSSPFLISGTKVVEGTGKMMVLCVGSRTYENILKAKLQDKDDKTPLQEKLADLADQIGKLGMWSAGITLAALYIHLAIGTIQGHHEFLSGQFFRKLVDYFIIAVSIIVMAVPEGLPLAVTISLAYSVGKMKDENNLVRFLQACETMGGANNICSDKTGTLTKNLMEVTQFWGQRTLFNRFNSNENKLNKQYKYLLNSAICLNSDAHPKIKRGGFEQIGNKTECALIELVYNWNQANYIDIRKSEKVVNTVPFSSARKRMSAICEMSDKKQYIFSKGAPQILINYCSHYIDRNGEAVTIDQDFREQLNANISSFASQSLRTLLICYRQLPGGLSNTEQPQKLENDLVVLGMAGIQDPLKETVPGAVVKCKAAGIIVRMVTGDNTETAIAIAKDANLIPKHYQRPAKGERLYYAVMEGKQFREEVGGIIEVEQNGQKKDKIKNIEKFKEITDQLRVLARSSPTDKYILATGLKELKNVVAMTGDGTNDAPALKKADIGFAMGLAGTQVAKEASGIILLDDNFSSIITAVKYGRNIFDCIRKFLQFQLTVNLVACFMAFLGSVVLKDSPLTAVQMLWINLIMDTLAALALATEPPSEELLTRMPYSRTESIINHQMWRTIVMNSLYQVFVLTIVLFKGHQFFNVPYGVGLSAQDWNHETGQHMTLFFNVLVFLTIFNFFNCRKLKKDEINPFTEFFDNFIFIAIVIAIFVLELFIVQVGDRVMTMVPLSVGQHLVCIIIGATMVVWCSLTKMIVPDSFLNNFALFREHERVELYHADNLFKHFMEQPATARRESRHRRSRAG